MQNFGRRFSIALAFFGMWLAFPVFGYVIPMMTLDHGDVASAMGATVFTLAGVIVGPFVAYIVVCLLWRGDGRRP